MNCRGVRAGTTLRSGEPGYWTSQTTQIVFGTWKIVIADRRFGCVVPRLPRPELRCVRWLKESQRHCRVLQLYAPAAKVQLAARRPEDARSALPWCLAAEAGLSPEVARAFRDGLGRNVRFRDLQKRSCAKRVFAAPQEFAARAASTHR